MYGRASMSSKPVVSSFISVRDYNPMTGDLTITFMDGSQGTYKNVPSQTVDGFDDSESPGSFLSNNLKNVHKWEKEGGS
jgi:hypothetical protein